MALNGTHFCKVWPGASGTLFQAANFTLLLAFLIPHTFSTSLIIRITVTCGQFVHVVWSSLYSCSLDVFAWSTLLALVNLAHTIYLILFLWPPFIFGNLRDLYKKMFEPLRVSKSNFHHLTRDTTVKWLESGEYYAIENITPCGRQLSILLEGKIHVSCDEVYLHYIYPNQFVDSVEWQAVEFNNVQNHFQVTMIAEGRCRCLVWPADKLRQKFTSRPILKSVMDCLIGKDITSKLYSLNDHMPGEIYRDETLNQSLVPSGKVVVKRSSETRGSYDLQNPFKCPQVYVIGPDKTGSDNYR